MFTRWSSAEKGFPGGGVVPGSGRSPGEGNGTPLQYSHLENSMEGGAWWATVHRSQRVGHDWATKHTHTRVHVYVCMCRGSLGGSVMKRCRFRRHGFHPCVRNIRWMRKQRPTPVFLSGKFHGQRSPGGYSPWGHKRVRHN